MSSMDQNQNKIKLGSKCVKKYKIKCPAGGAEQCCCSCCCIEYKGGASNFTYLRQRDPASKQGKKQASKENEDTQGKELRTQAISSLYVVNAKLEKSGDKLIALAKTVTAAAAAAAAATFKPFWGKMHV